jgi:hypothetical protein
MGLTYQIQYKKGADNRVADALSRLPQTVPYEIAAIYVIKPVLLQDLQAALLKNPPPFSYSHSYLSALLKATIFSKMAL